MIEPIGINYLMAGDHSDGPLDPSKWATCSAWTNPNVKCVVIRTDWGRMEPVKGQYYYDWIDEGINQANAHGKKCTLLVVAGVGVPEWFSKAHPRACFLVTEVREKDGTKVKALMGLPWRPAFQTAWRTFIQSLDARYDGQAVHIEMGGFGRKAESYFVTDPDDQAGIQSIAKSQHYADAEEAWLTGAKWVMDIYGVFTKSGIVAVLGPPFPTKRGGEVIKELTDYGAAKYPGMFGCAADAITNTGLIFNLPAGVRRGWQFGLPKGDDIAGFNAAIQTALKAKPEWIEVYPIDCDDPRKAATLAEANMAMLQ